MHFFVVKAVRNANMFLLEFRDVTTTLIGGGGGVYSFIHVLLGEFLSKFNSNGSIGKETRRAEHEYMNMHPPPSSKLKF